MKVSIDIEAKDIALAALGLSHKDAADLILQIDLMLADAGFTEIVIRKLVCSLKGDVADDPSSVDLPFIDWTKVPNKP